MTSLYLWLNDLRVLTCNLRANRSAFVNNYTNTLVILISHRQALPSVCYATLSLMFTTHGRDQI